MIIHLKTTTLLLFTRSSLLVSKQSTASLILRKARAILLKILSGCQHIKILTLRPILKVLLTMDILCLYRNVLLTMNLLSPLASVALNFQASSNKLLILMVFQTTKRRIQPFSLVWHSHSFLVSCSVMLCTVLYCSVLLFGFIGQDKNLVTLWLLCFILLSTSCYWWESFLLSVVFATTITHQFLFIFSGQVVMTSCLRMIHPIALMSAI